MSVSVMPFPMADITFGERNLDRHPSRHGGKPFVMAEIISQFRMLWRKLFSYGGNCFTASNVMVEIHFLMAEIIWPVRTNGGNDPFCGGCSTALSCS
jgi:hypothetical protein